MRKILMVLAVIGIVASPVFAQGDVKEAIGTIDSIDPIDPARGDFDGGIVLRDTSSSVTNFNLAVTTVISDQVTGKIVSGDIRDGDKVRVTYSGSGREPDAITILRLPADKQ